MLEVGADELSNGAEQLQDFEAGSRAGMLFAGLAGAIAITAELRYGTIRPTFLVTPAAALCLRRSWPWACLWESPSA